MAEKQTIDAMWDDSPIDVSTEVNFIWSIANKLRGTYQSDKYKDVIIPMVIIRRFECALEPTKDKVVAQFKANPNYPAKAMYRISGFQFYNTSEFTLAELINDADHLAANFKAYLQSFSLNVQEIIVSAEKGLDFYKQIDKMDKNNRLLSVVKAFSELDLNPSTIDNVKMGYIFEDLIRRFSENAEAGDHYTGRDIIKLMVTFFWLKAATIFSMMEKLLQFWTKRAEPAVCFPRDTTSSSVITRQQTCAFLGRKSIRNLMLSVLQRCLSKDRMQKISAIRIL